jgi:hypothetical protein
MLDTVYRILNQIECFQNEGDFLASVVFYTWSPSQTKMPKKVNLILLFFIENKYHSFILKIELVASF